VSEKKVIVVVLAPLVGGVPVRDPDDDGGEHPLPVLTTRTPGGYGLTTKEKRSSGHVTWLRVGEPCDPTTVDKGVGASIDYPTVKPGTCGFC
jgi:hypothetical protein